ncbi:hypothetical protein SEA_VALENTINIPUFF_25 [Microbacterium phage ValentiniPuff]|uniref:Uncharacterized protein n=1 Tax=Microbacterium phage ValentiniPuff TaxID=2315705 RepID=A0A386KPQ7_9CAUD|nr:hypothetical protein SEA_VALENTINIPUFF_25 [Microbacterium phage ValentiniPuff]
MTLCRHDGTRHPYNEGICPSPLDRLSLQEAIAAAGHYQPPTMQVLTPQGAWVDVTVPLKPDVPHIIRYRTRSSR